MSKLTITAVNPYSGAVVELGAEDMINPVDSYPFDQAVSDRVSGEFKTDWEWVVAYSKLVTPKEMGAILLGS